MSAWHRENTVGSESQHIGTNYKICSHAVGHVRRMYRRLLGLLASLGLLILPCIVPNFALAHEINTQANTTGNIVNTSDGLSNNRVNAVQQPNIVQKDSAWRLGADGKQHNITWDKDSLFIDGKRLAIYGEEIHPWRYPSESAWRDLCQKVKSAGFNTISFYLYWGLHQQIENGSFNFSDFRNTDTLLNIAEETGLYVIVRPGPYINAELNNGGLPDYTTNWGGHFRDGFNEQSMRAQKQWLDAVNHIIAKHQITKGLGSVVLYQVENEMPSDKQPYQQELMRKLVSIVRADGITVPLFLNDWGANGFFKDSAKYGLSFYATDFYPLGFNCEKPRRQLIEDFPARIRANTGPNAPLFIPEIQGGARSAWGAHHNVSQCAVFVDGNFWRQWFSQSLPQGLNMEVSYLAAGGTNWGWTSSPESGFSSYDHGDGISQERNLREKYMAQKEIGYLQKAVGTHSGNNIIAPTVKTLDGSDAQSFARVYSDSAQSSVTGLGTRIIGLRHTDSNATDTSHHTIVLDLTKNGLQSEQTAHFTNDDADSQLTYTGSWQHTNNVGSAYKHTVSTSSHANDTVTWKFTGTGFEIYPTYGTDKGYAQVTVDGNIAGKFTAYVDTNQNLPSQVAVFSKKGLPNGEHTVVVTVLGQHPQGSSGDVVGIDAFNVLSDNNSQGSHGNTSSSGTNGIVFPKVPQDPQSSIQLVGRDGIMMIADAKIGPWNMYYSTAQPFVNMDTTQGRLFALLASKGTVSETVLHVDSKPIVTSTQAVKTHYDPATGQLRLDTQHTDMPYTVVIKQQGKEPLLLRILDRVSARRAYWNTDPQTGLSVYSEGSYLVRSVHIANGVASVQTSENQPTTLHLWVAKGISGVRFNNQSVVPVVPTANSQSSVTVHLDGPEKVDVPILHWVAKTGSAESGMNFDDSSFTVANGTTSPNPNQTVGEHAGVILDSNYYGFHNGAVWYRGHVQGKVQGNATITITGATGRAGNALVWWDGVYLGSVNAPDGMLPFSKQLDPAGGPISGSFVIPQQLRGDGNHTIAILVNTQGIDLDWSDAGASQKIRGLHDVDIPIENAHTVWKIQGNLGGEYAPDTLRTYYNNGGLYGEREGWYLPTVDTHDWKAVNDFHVANPSVRWYVSRAQLNVPKNQDASFALDVTSQRFGTLPTDTHNDHSRAILFVNGWNVGEYVGDVGPQTHFPIPDRFINLRGNNTFAVAVIASQPQAGPERIDLHISRNVTMAMNDMMPTNNANQQELDNHVVHNSMPHQLVKNKHMIVHHSIQSVRHLPATGSNIVICYIAMVVLLTVSLIIICTQRYGFASLLHK